MFIDVSGLFRKGVNQVPTHVEALLCTLATATSASPWVVHTSERRSVMARVCQVTGKGPMSGNNVSHANNKTKRRFLPNLQYRRFWVESENRWVRLRISTAALRLIDKVGIDQVLSDLRARGEL